eukprot:CAMPEP_0118691254 /NCGR_PEP_ID=MMETSP0800-20121206/10574_1 /TAXON_ID=210618 ORGANISM="Striatella unipunctata, Strain CCMP2910" /NCGR_SAMPLE_ID=MMETSP0800 /ASSEMBLY_ACC=CAM_ASM_000638 /LENGTH=867 /DNA_ID=CAMNT_0006589005 /DNA_START=310 /DNA_END=2913 /DNA_ORIENTATION=-
MSISQRWSRAIECIRSPMLKAVYAISHHAASYPKTYVIGTIIFSLGLMVLGLLTNFAIDVDEDALWTPMNSKPIQHGDWIEDNSGFPKDARFFNIFIHAQGNENALSVNGMERVFAAVDSVRDTPGYDELCKLAGPYGVSDENGDITCAVRGATRFWNNSVDIFNSEIASDEEVMKKALSSDTYPDGEPVDLVSVLGFSKKDDNGVLTTASSFTIRIDLPPNEDEAEPFEADALDRILALQNEWIAEKDNKFRLEVFAERSFTDEFTRAITRDIPLIPGVFVVMSIFCCIIFARRDAVKSQSLLGFGAVVAVFLSIASGYGLLFLLGVPFTSLTQILPFVMFGIGLDNAFIIAGSYSRTDKGKEPVERVKDTMEDIGGSIMLTTCTSAIAFGLGATSSIPAVRWLCLYAFPTILFDFLYQITFFVALIVIDENRMKNNRRDWAVCCTVKNGKGEESTSAETKNISTRIMESYSNVLMKPVSKGIVIILFCVLLGLGAWRASELKQSFDFTEVIPSDSYITTFVDNRELYAEERTFAPEIYFRDVNFADSLVQDEMTKYVNELEKLKQVSEGPVFFWLYDFKDWLSDKPDIQSVPFEEQLDKFLEIPSYNLLYGNDIVRNEDGVMTASRTQIYMDLIDGDLVTEQIDALFDQRDITKTQPANEGEKEWKFFTWMNEYYIWEFYSVAVDELILTTVLGVVAVSVIAMTLIPHWTAVFFVAPMVCILYIELLGVIQIAGLHVNSVTYISMVMSIGLMVDYVMHVVIRYYESEKGTREEKVRDTLSTMGSSILIGGISTLLGVIPLAFSTSSIFTTIFVSFIGLVLLGCAHGLILLPVVLSMVGPLGARLGHEPSDDKGIATTEHNDDSSA